MIRCNSIDMKPGGDAGLLSLQPIHPGWRYSLFMQVGKVIAITRDICFFEI